MAFMELKELSFQYSDQTEAALHQFSLTVEQGQFIAVAGPSGCGKTTLLKLLKREITPVGNISGTITFENQPMEELEEGALANDIGYLFQNPENQIVMDDVLSELAFGLENQGLSSTEMRQRIAEMTHFFGLESLLHADTYTLSGGQKQLINLASILLLKPKLLLLDEPTAQLDPVQSKEFLQFLRRLNEEFGITIILVEHRLEEIYPIVDQVLFMHEGGLPYSGSPREVIQQIWLSKDTRFLAYLPTVARLFFQFQVESFPVSEIPLTVKESHSWLEQLKLLAVSAREMKEPVSPRSEDTQNKIEHPLLQVKNIYYKYKRETPYILKNLSLEIAQGDYLAIVGGNGSGKTTLLKCCTGILKPQKGSIKLDHQKINASQKKGDDLQVGYLPQNPLVCFMAETLDEELHHLALRLGLDFASAKERIASLTAKLGIKQILTKHIHDCSGGEQQKAALATILIDSPRLLVLDEPTKGMDPVSKQDFAVLLKELHQEGITILLVTHDIEFAAEHAQQCAWLFDGNITAKGSIAEVLQGNYFYTTTMNRVSRKRAEAEVLTLEEACSTWSIHAPS